MATEAHNTNLTSVAEKVLSVKCKPQTLAYCPTMDLVALANEDEQVHVYRLNGQKVFGGVYGNSGGGGGGGSGGGGVSGSELQVRIVKWKASGNLLAVVCSDNKIRMLGAYSGKTVHSLACSPPSSPPPSSCSSKSLPVSRSASISCVGWGVNFTDSKTALRNLQDAEGRLTVDDLLSPETQLTKLAALKADLPRELALLDIERSLPKLSTLPSTGDEDDVFSSRASVDSIFHSPNRNSGDSVDVLLAGFDDGTIHLRIFDSFEIGSLRASSSLGGPGTYKPLLHASHPVSSTHSLLFSAPDSGNKIRLLTLDLLFITKSGIFLSLLASKVTQLQNLLRYIGQVQNQILLEWKNAQDLPKRYIRNINEDLQERCLCNFVTSAYHLLVTGDCFEPLKEFLVDQVGERGHRRWEKAVTSGYEALRRLTHECLLPALERCGVLLSRLIGLSKFHKLNHVLGLETKDLKECLDTVDCLNLLSHKVLIYSGREIHEFAAFAKWLKYEIELQSADPLSATVEELVERSDTFEYGQILNYIQGALTRSSLHDFIQPPSEEQQPGRWAPIGQDSSFYETYKKLLQQQGQQKSNDGLSLPMLYDLTARLGSQCGEVFRRIAETQRRGILHRSPLVLSSDCDANVVDMTMNFSGFDADMLCSVYIAAKSCAFPSIFYIYRLILDSVNGVSSTRSTFVAKISLQEGRITQIKFVEDGTLMLLWFDGESTHLVNFPYRHNPEAPFAPNFIKIVDGSDPASPSSIPTDQVTQIHLLDQTYHASFICHTFPAQRDMGPMTLQVNGKKGRRVVCVLYSDGLRYSVFDLDSASDGDDEAGLEDGGHGQPGDEDHIMAD